MARGKKVRGVALPPIDASPEEIARALFEPLSRPDRGQEPVRSRLLGPPQSITVRKDRPPIDGLRRRKLKHNGAQRPDRGSAFKVHMGRVRRRIVDKMNLGHGFLPQKAGPWNMAAA